MNWIDFKAMLAANIIEMDALHIYAAFAVQAVAAIILRSDLRKWGPWLCVLGLALLNEAADVFYSKEPGFLEPWQIYAAVHDIANTMLLPTFLLLLCRHLPQLVGARAP